MPDEINIQFTRFSAFYTPLIATIAGGFLQEEGFEPKHSVAPAGKSAIEAVVNGTAVPLGHASEKTLYVNPDGTAPRRPR